MCRRYGQASAHSSLCLASSPRSPLFPPKIASVHEAFHEWFEGTQPELETIPGKLNGLTPKEKLIFIRAVRGDRIPAMLPLYIEDAMGAEYVNQPPFDMTSTYQESTASTPIFFVLFPGVDPTPWVEALATPMGITIAAGNFVNISMGQGQEAPAENMLEKMAASGGWVMLQNLHLMQSWLTRLDRKLEICSETAHDDFRCFVSGEPPSFSYQKNMPESLLQSCIKVANEAPSDMKSNMRRAYAAFDASRLDDCEQPTEVRETRSRGVAHPFIWPPRTCRRLGAAGSGGRRAEPRPQSLEFSHAPSQPRARGVRSHRRGSPHHHLPPPLLSVPRHPARAVHVPLAAGRPHPVRPAGVGPQVLVQHGRPDHLR